MEQVEADIEEAARVCPDVERVFLEHGDAFVLPADRLIKIADVVHAMLPKVKTIAMYASIQNTRHKTDAELRRLHAERQPFDWRPFSRSSFPLRITR